jgi:hypothetical protein
MVEGNLILVQGCWECFSRHLIKNTFYLEKWMLLFLAEKAEHTKGESLRGPINPATKLFQIKIPTIQSCSPAL